MKRRCDINKQKFLDGFVLDCIKIFSGDLVCLLLVGSVLKKDTTPFSDIDFVVLLRKIDIEKLKKIRARIAESEILIDFAVLCIDESPSCGKDFILGSHGCYYLELVIKKARCLYGKNIFLEIEPASLEDIKDSLFRKIAEYVWNARRGYIESNRERSIESNYKFNSRLLKLIKDFLFIADIASIDISNKKAIDILINSFQNIFSEEDVEILRRLSNNKRVNENAGDMSEKYFAHRVLIMDKIYRKAKEIYNLS